MQPFITTTQVGRQLQGLRPPPAGAAIVGHDVARLSKFFSPGWIKSLSRSAAAADPDLQRAVEMLQAIDAGGVPLNPARVNDVARRLGLEVSAHARMDDTVGRIRAAVGRRQA
jgi:hypothetical protein